MPQASHPAGVCAGRAGPLRCPGWIGALTRHIVHGGHMRLRRAVIGTASALALVAGGVAPAHLGGGGAGRPPPRGGGPPRPPHPTRRAPWGPSPPPPPFFGV